MLKRTLLTQTTLCSLAILATVSLAPAAHADDVTIVTTKQRHHHKQQIALTIPGQVSVTTVPSGLTADQFYRQTQTEDIAGWHTSNFDFVNQCKGSQEPFTIGY
jgi:hypothetical protein